MKSQNYKPLVTILIPTFNRADVILRALDSALNQTYENFEIVVVDDGSSDGTRDLLSPYIEDGRIRYIAHPLNKGITSARNTLLNNADGEWFAFLSSDDELYPEAVETIMQMALEFPDVNWFCAHMIDVENGEYACKNENAGYMAKGSLTRPNNGCNESWYIAKKDAIGGERFIEGLNTFESEWQLRIADNLTKYFVNKPLYIYHTEYDNRVSKSYENGTNTKTYEDQWLKVIRENPDYLIERIKNGLGGDFLWVIQLLRNAGEDQLAQQQIEIAKQHGIEILETNQKDTKIEVSFFESAKRLVVKVMRFLKLKAPKPPEEQ